MKHPTTLNQIFVTVFENKFTKAYLDRADTILPLEAALQQKWQTDAHFVCYDSNVRVAKTHPDPLFAQIFALDFDNPKHEPWRYESQVSEWFDNVTANIDNWYAIYTTRSGGRVVFVLDEPVPVKKLNLIYQEFKGLPGVDTQCLTWTRLFRLPYVRRPEPTWTDPFVDLVISGNVYNGSPSRVTEIPINRPGPECRDLVWTRH